MTRLRPLWDYGAVAGTEAKRHKGEWVYCFIHYQDRLSWFRGSGVPVVIALEPSRRASRDEATARRAVALSQRVNP